MRPKNIHTVPKGRHWGNKRAGGTRFLSVHRLQSSAIALGKRLARRDRVEHFIHDYNGRIRERNSYGRDPYPPKG